MKRTLIVLAIAVRIATIVGSSNVIAQDTLRVATAPARQAAPTATPKFTFIFFWKENNAATQNMNVKLKAALAQKSEQAELTAVNVNDAANQAIVERYKVSRAPMPMVMCVAANGAITGAISDKVTEDAVDRLMVTPTMTQCMKALQENKLVLVHVKADDNAVIPKGANEFAADPAFQARTTMVSFRRDDPNETRFLSDMQIDSKTSGSLVALLAPPGVLVGKYADSVAKAQIAAELHAAGQCCNDPNCKHNKKGK